jgi:hypothetical protein
MSEMRMVEATIDNSLGSRPWTPAEVASLVGQTAKVTPGGVWGLSHGQVYVHAAALDGDTVRLTLGTTRTDVLTAVPLRLHCGFIADPARVRLFNVWEERP